MTDFMSKACLITLIKIGYGINDRQAKYAIALNSHTQIGKNHNLQS